MAPFIVGIAGGSGSGKTTIALALKKYLAKRATILNLDNYQKFGQKLPVIRGMKNWDHPRSVDWKQFIHNLRSLKQGKQITISQREQKKLSTLKRILLKPTLVLIVEGYLLFHLYSVRKLLDVLIFTGAKDQIRIKRRTKFKNEDYVKYILLPMHHKYIEPTKKYADLILNTEKDTLQKCVLKV